MPIFPQSRFVTQSAAAVLSYGRDWSPMLAQVEGDAIASSTWSAPGLQLSLESEDDGVASVSVGGGTPGQVYTITNAIVTAVGRHDAYSFYLSIAAADAPPVFKTALFDRFTSVDRFRATSVGDAVALDRLDDDEIWNRLVSAEADLAHELRVLLQPTRVFPERTPQAVLDALPVGEAFVTEPGYDFDPSGWNTDSWGFTQLNYAPILDIESVQIVYPSTQQTLLNVPPEWLEMDHKYGHLRFVPSGRMVGLTMLTSFMITTLNSGRRLPGALRITYTAGLANAARDYPELVTLAQRMATIAMMKNAVTPSSASISADGLSESVSYDAVKLQDEIDRDVEKLRDRIKGIRMVAL